MTARANSWWGEAVVPWIKVQGATELGSGQGRDVLIVSHAGFIGVLLKALRKGTVRMEGGVRMIKCMNASITVIDFDPVAVTGKISRCSDVSHLTGPMAEENVDAQDVDAPPDACTDSP